MGSLARMRPVRELTEDEQEAVCTFGLELAKTTLLSPLEIQVKVAARFPLIFEPILLRVDPSPCLHDADSCPKCM
jgi:hypothetical protein